MTTLQEIAQWLWYDAETGVLTWRKKPLSSRVRVGDVAGTIDANGYRVVGLRRKYFKAHRIIFYIVYGREPIGVIDHINGDKTDNRLANLRECTHQENCQNAKRAKNNTSGYPGVHWHKRLGKWAASIRINRKARHLGYFDSPEMAYHHYRLAKALLHSYAPDGCDLPPLPTAMLTPKKVKEREPV